MTPNLSHTPQTADLDTSNTLGKHFHQCRLADFDEQLKDDLNDWHPRIVALSGRSVKKGNSGCSGLGVQIVSQIPLVS